MVDIAPLSEDENCREMTWGSVHHLESRYTNKLDIVEDAVWRSLIVSQFTMVSLGSS